MSYLDIEIWAYFDIEVFNIDGIHLFNVRITRSINSDRKMFIFHVQQELADTMVLLYIDHLGRFCSS